MTYPIEIEKAKVSNEADTSTSQGDPVIKVPLNVRSAALSILAILALVFALRFAQEVFIPVVLSILITYALNPIVSWVARLRIHRALASGVVLLGLVAGTSATIYTLRDEFSAVLDSVPQGARKLRQRLEANRGAGPGTFDKVQEAASEIERTAEQAAGESRSPRGVARVQIEEPAFRASEYLWWGSKGIAAFLVQATMIFFLVYFLLASGDLYKRKLVKMVGPTFSQKRLTVEILDDINGQIEQFLLVQVLTSLLVAVVTGIALWWFGVNQPTVWGLAAGIFNSIPYFGPAIVTVGLALVSFLQFGTLSMAAYVGGIALVITTLEGFLLTPALMGRAARMNQVAVFIGLLFWSWMWGVWGMILAVPIMMVIKTLCERIEGLRPIGDLLGEK